MDILVILTTMVVVSMFWSLWVYRRAVKIKTEKKLKKISPKTNRDEYKYEIRENGVNCIVDYAQAFKFIYRIIYWSHKIDITKQDGLVKIRKSVKGARSYGNDG